LYFVSCYTFTGTQTKASVPYSWGVKQENAFREIKQALTSSPVLKLPDPSQPYEVIADASINGLGAVLVQQGHPVACYSRKFSQAEKNYTAGQLVNKSYLHSMMLQATVALLSQRSSNYLGN
jgi:hypothetical protein